MSEDEIVTDMVNERLGPARRVRQSPRLAARSIEGKGVVIVLDRQVVHTLNGVGMRVFELADGRSLNDIAAVLTQEFEVPHERALADTSHFVSELVDMGALEVIGAP